MTKLVELDIDFRKLDQLAKGFKGYRLAMSKELRRALRDTVLDIEREAKENAPVKTGRLRASITPEIHSPYEGNVGTNVEYAPDVEYGTEPHEITPTSAKTLRFPSSEGNGSHAFAKRVQHPGTEALPFMEPAFRAGEKLAQKHYTAAFKRLERLLGK